MLVLTRKREETIIIDDRIEIQILRVSPNSVRIGIDAPRDVSIRRGELERHGLKVRTEYDESVEVPVSCSHCH